MNFILWGPLTDYDAGNREDTSAGAMALETGSFKIQKKYITVLASSAGWQGYIKHCSWHKSESRLGELRRLFSTTKMAFEEQHTDSSLPLLTFL